MSRQQRFGLVALAAAVAVAAFVIARPGDDDEPADTAAATSAQTEATTPTETQPAETETQPAEPEATRIRVEGGRPAGGVEEIAVNTGDTVRLTVSSDAPQEIHLHGYDLIENAAPGAPARFSFEADIEGVFEVEVEGAHTQIAELRVEP